MIRIQTDDFSLSDEHERLSARSTCGAVVTFTGLVRELATTETLVAMVLEHYPGMTEQSLNNIADTAIERWDLGQVTIIHRVGQLKPNEQIVFVGVASAHRTAAFEAAQFIMDFLKTEAPFWKKEITDRGTHWVEAKASDQLAAEHWHKND